MAVSLTKTPQPAARPATTWVQAIAVGLMAAHVGARVIEIQDHRDLAWSALPAAFAALLLILSTYVFRGQAPGGEDTETDRPGRTLWIVPLTLACLDIVTSTSLR